MFVREVEGAKRAPSVRRLRFARRVPAVFVAEVHGRTEVECCSGRDVGRGNALSPRYIAGGDGRWGSGSVCVARRAVFEGG